MIAAALSVHFEAGDLFVLANLGGFACFDDAQRALTSGISLTFEDNWISVVCPGREPQRLCPDNSDECGRWPAGADRFSHEEQWAAQLSMPDFVLLCSVITQLCPVWASIVEWEKGADHRFKEIRTSASGSIGTLAPR